MQIKQISLILLAIFLISASILYLFISKEALISYIVAFLTSSIVVLASFKNYKNMVLKRLDTLDSVNEVENKDVIDKLEDPYGLYNEDEPIEDIKTLKAELKKHKRSTKEIAKDSLSAFAPLRIFAYIILVVGFFYLLNSNSLDLKFYIPTLIVPNLISVIYFVFFAKN